MYGIDNEYFVKSFSVTDYGWSYTRVEFYKTNRILPFSIIVRQRWNCIQFRQESLINTFSVRVSWQYRVSSDLRISRRSRVSSTRKTDATKRMKETVESELCKQFYFTWIFNIESRDFASRLLFIETFSSLDTVIDNRPWTEFFSHAFIERTDMFIPFSSSLSYLFSLIYYLLLFCYQVHIKYIFQA